ncbi:hypothetical protein Pan14r_50650 [Crateriforma conspicua]|uniref:Uncharacterized protein n=1 Tax=Crateriforma conspicua TaxID=2527996 RepID=A0A5C5XSA7_9PLAN|nr:hypothetical protein Mal65_53080 [Crateriforma conspicua]TWT65519.1 hypothetical protein Pan14r_50650 [Crateriforma conspicua]
MKGPSRGVKRLTGDEESQVEDVVRKHGRCSTSPWGRWGVVGAGGAVASGVSAKHAAIMTDSSAGRYDLGAPHGTEKWKLGGGKSQHPPALPWERCVVGRFSHHLRGPHHRPAQIGLPKRHPKIARCVESRLSTIGTHQFSTIPHPGRGNRSLWGIKSDETPRKRPKNQAACPAKTATLLKDRWRWSIRKRVADRIGPGPRSAIKLGPCSPISLGRL